MEPIVRSPHPMPPRLRAVKIVSGYTVHLTYVDGVEREIDLEPYLHGEVFDPIRQDPELFALVKIDEAGDTICWPNGADIAPETLYYSGEPPWVTQPKRVRSSAKRAVRKPLKRRAARKKTKVTA
jgi:Protein of unknown function (DUF2442)